MLEVPDKCATIFLLSTMQMHIPSRVTFIALLYQDRTPSSIKQIFTSKTALFHRKSDLSVGNHTPKGPSPHQHPPPLPFQIRFQLTTRLNATKKCPASRKLRDLLRVRYDPSYLSKCCPRTRFAQYARQYASINAKVLVPRLPAPELGAQHCATDHVPCFPLFPIPQIFHATLDS